eukprot:Nk52_evm9s1945 gene=Nk52_evmTU9s1945
MGSVFSTKSKTTGSAGELLEACRDGNMPLIKTLLQEGQEINPSYRLSIFSLQNEPDLPPSPLAVAAQHGRLEAVKYLVGKGAEVEPDMTQHPLILAAGAGHIEVVEYLVKEAGANVNAVVFKQHTAMRYACLKDNQKMVQVLLDNGALINNEPKLFKNTYVMADMNGGTKQPPPAVDIYYSPLHCAVSAGKKGMVKFLIEKGAKVNQLGIDFHWSKEAPAVLYTPLQLAIHNGHNEVAKVLIKSKAKVNYEDEQICIPFVGSPLWMAAYKGNEEMVKILAGNRKANVFYTSDVGIDPVTKAPSEKMTPQQVASHMEYPELARYLEIIVNQQNEGKLRYL